MEKHHRLEQPIEIKLNSALSKRDYKIYTLISNKKEIGILIVYFNGIFKYSLATDSYDEQMILNFIKGFIRNNLKLIPLESNPH